MVENYTVCNCMKVSYNDIADAMHKLTKFEDVLTTFKSVQEMTYCSTGCGGCHQKVLDTISELLNSRI